MFAFRCTQKLLTRIKAVPAPEPSRTDTVLGDWYANLVRAGRMQVVLAISERTLLPVVVPAKEGRTLVQRFSEALEPVLLSIGIATEEVARERSAMAQSVIAKTASRRVLGSLNDLAFHLEVGLFHWPDRPLIEQALWLAQTPMKLIDYGAPEDATIAAFAAHRVLRQVSSSIPGGSTSS